MISILLIGLCMLSVVVVLYRNLDLLTGIPANDRKMGILRITTLFHIGILIVGILITLFAVSDVMAFPESQEKMVVAILISCVILFSGIISPKLPFNRHTGLRLPWTVQDEATWNLAQKS